MDDAEYVATEDGQETARALISAISPTAASPRQYVRDAYNQLTPEQRRIVKAYLRMKMNRKTKGKKLNNRESHVLSIIGV